MKNEKNEKIILTIGFVLILFVIVLTLFRNSSSSNSGKSKAQLDSLTDKQTTTPYKTISANELNKKIITSGDKDGVVLLDIRPFEAYAQEHIMDAVNITLDEFPVASKIDAHNLVVVIGSSNVDKNIPLAIEKLEQEDYSDVTVLAGGMDAWKQLIGSTVNFGDPKSFVDQSKVSYLEPADLNSALTQEVPVFILDVRSSDEYASGHIKGAKNIPFEDLEKRRREIKEKKVVVIGANELQEFQASVQLYDMLLVSPFIMRTAMPGWQEKGFALVK